MFVKKKNEIFDHNSKVKIKYFYVLKFKRTI